ncbi:unnamed protein product [Clavelina lepadiformis]|uniref:Uncharacterized protein n=1 Tax=Clavelina lepadiformis TaxID=159417 RepID=A0ABP0FAL8_CLALP
MNYVLLVLVFTYKWLTITIAHEATLCVNLCPPCFPQRMRQECPPQPNCRNLVKGPGCSCCMVCASEEGDRCGINLPKCAEGLQCLGKHGKPLLRDYYHNRGACQTQAIRDRESTRTTGRRGSKKGRRVTRHPHHGLLYPLNFDGPCSRHYEKLMTSCGTLPVTVWLPNCDHHGYYERKQCLSSKGMLRGKCWCVNENGMALPGTPFTRRSFECGR